MEISGKSYHIQLELSSFLPGLFRKLAEAGIRFLAILKNLPVRIYRLFHHIGDGLGIVLQLIQALPNSRPMAGKKVWLWWAELLVLFLECLGVAELYETLFDFVKFNTRSLNDWEVELLQSVFGDSINYKRIRIDEWAIAGPRQKKFCYVSFYTINSWGPMQNSLLVHELMHVWQYERVGAVYIPKALAAQFSKEGYNYGGAKKLRSCLAGGKKLTDFNFEQQGDIISDYYRIKEGFEPRWGNGNRRDLDVYEKFKQQLES